MTQGQYTSFSATKAFLSQLRVNAYPGVRVHVLDEVDTFNYGGVSAMSPFPAPTSSYSFGKLDFAIDS